MGLNDALGCEKEVYGILVICVNPPDEYVGGPYKPWRIPHDPPARKAFMAEREAAESPGKVDTSAFASLTLYKPKLLADHHRMVA